MRTLWQDLRYVARMLFKHKGFTFVTALVLSLGIGANTAIFSVVNAVLLRPLPYKNAERLVALYSVNTGNAEANLTDRPPLSYPDFRDYKEQTQTLQYVAAYRQIGTSLVSSGGDEPERVLGADVSAELFPMLGVEPLIGRVFTPEEDKAGAPSVVVLGYGLWQRRFGGDKAVIGREIKLGTRNVTVIGVMPPDFKFPIQAERADFFDPFTAETARISPASLESRDSRFNTIVASLKPGATLQQAQAEIDAIARRLEAQYPAMNTGWRVRLVPLGEDVTGDVRPALLVLLGAVLFVLLITCANVANMLLAKASARQKEMAIRTALGASRARIVRQLLTESLVLSLIGGALGLLLALWGVDLLVAASPASLPRVNEINVDNHVLAFTLIVSVITGIIFGIAPALASSKLDLNEALKEGGRSETQGAQRNRVRSLLVVSEVALSLVLLIGAGLLIKSFLRLLNTDTGYKTARVLSVTLPVSKTKYPQPEQQVAYVREIIDRTRTLPGVEATAATTLLPLGLRDIFNVFDIEGRPPAPPEAKTAARNCSITPDYFRVMNIPMRRGRIFTERDTKDALPVIIINEAFASRFFPSEDPVGHRIILRDERDQPSPPREIVGVVGNIKHESLDEKEQPEYYVPFYQTPDRQMDLVVRSATNDPAAMTFAVRSAIKSIDKDQLIWEVKTMDERVAESVAPRRFQMLLLGIFAALALLLASIGIYGVMSYLATQRTHEIGIRIALGAQRSDVLRLIVGQGMRLALIGVGIGLVCAFAVTRLMQSLLYGVSATDPIVFAGVALVLTIVALLACYIPARRAAKVDPVIALRHE